MENRERNNFYAVPLIGGILCLITFLFPDLYYFTPLGGYNFILLIGFLIFIILEIICGNIMLYTAIRMGVGRTTFSKQKTKLLIFSWLVFGLTLVTSFFATLSAGFLFLVNRLGLIGCLITIIGIYYYERTAKRGLEFAQTLETNREKIEPSLTKENVYYIAPKFCINCGLNLKEGKFKFCPECGHQLTK